MQTTTTSLWMNENGCITCPEHGGRALAAEANRAHHPLTIITDLDVWTRVTEDERAAWAAAYGEAAAREVARCEFCRLG